MCKVDLTTNYGDTNHQPYTWQAPAERYREVPVCWYLENNDDRALFRNITFIRRLALNSDDCPLGPWKKASEPVFLMGQPFPKVFFYNSESLVMVIFSDFEKPCRHSFSATRRLSPFWHRWWYRPVSRALMGTAGTPGSPRTGVNPKGFL